MAHTAHLIIPFECLIFVHVFMKNSSSYAWFNVYDPHALPFTFSPPHSYTFFFSFVLCVISLELSFFFDNQRALSFHSFPIFHSIVLNVVKTMLEYIVANNTSGPHIHTFSHCPREKREREWKGREENKYLHNERTDTR